MHPHIEIKLRPINTRRNYNDPDYDDNEEGIYHVIISENKLKMLFTVKWQEPGLNKREFQVIRHDHLYLDGQDKGQVYPIGNHPYGGTISADNSVVQELFSDNLDPYQIRLDKVTVHNHLFYESINFTFVDPQLLETLYDRINEACLKAKFSPSGIGIR